MELLLCIEFDIQDDIFDVEVAVVVVAAAIAAAVISECSRAVVSPAVGTIKSLIATEVEDTNRL